MSSVNKVILIGNLGGDPETRTVNDTTVTSMSLATTETWKDKNGQKQERTEWHRINVWGPQGENVAKYLSKGSKAYVEGKLETRSYEKDGQKKYSTEVRADRVVFLDGKKGGGEDHGAERY
jgi:single-strand DNA-binding protein